MMKRTQEWNFSRWNDNSKTMFLDSRFCMWEQGGRIYFKDTHTQSKTSLMEVYNGSVKKGFQRALVHFENFISIAKAERSESKRITLSGNFDYSQYDDEEYSHTDEG